MARPREFDTEVAIAKIADVFWGSGVEATSITDLEDATGLARARLYAGAGHPLADQAAADLREYRRHAGR